MTCRGYDPKTVKLSKTIKRAAALIRNDHVRGAFIRSYVEIEQSNSRMAASRRDRSK